MTRVVHKLLIVKGKHLALATIQVYIEVVILLGKVYCFCIGRCGGKDVEEPDCRNHAVMPTV
jgi:hypothetical protein